MKWEVGQFIPVHISLDKHWRHGEQMPSPIPQKGTEEGTKGLILTKLTGSASLGDMVVLKISILGKKL